MSQNASAVRLFMAIATPSEDTISPVYSGCRTQRYGPRSTTSRACASTDMFRPSDRSDHTDHDMPHTSSTSETACLAGPGGVACRSGSANGIQVAATAATWAVAELLV